MELSQAESGEDAVSEVEESDDNYSCVSLLPPSSRIPRTCTALRANLFIANPIHNAYPDTQAEVSVTNRPEHVLRKHPRSSKLQGLLGKPQVAQYADLAFRLKTDKGRAILLRLRKPGLFLPEAKEILLAHQGLEDAGFRVNYHTGKVHAPGGHALTMIKSCDVWQIPVMPPPKHTVLAATTTTPETTTFASTTMQDVEHMHEVLCCAGATTMLRYYKHYHGTGFGKASTAAVRNFRCPIKALMQGDANPKSRRTQDAQTESTHPPPPADTTDVHAHAAHSDAEDDVCACCADQPAKGVQFTATEPWPTLRGSASELFIRMKRQSGANGGRPLAQGERTTGASAQPSAPGEQAQGEQAQGEQAQGEQAPTWTAMPARCSTTYRKAAGILKRAVAPRDEWHIDWSIIGQKTLGLNSEAYAIVVLDVGSNLGAVINTRTREDPWQNLDELAALWGHTPKAIRGDGTAKFMHADGFKAWRRKHQILFKPIEFYRHTMQGHIENLVKQVKTHSRCILKHTNLPTRFWSETTTMYMAVRNIMPSDKMTAPFTEARPHRLHFDPKLLLHRPGCLVIVKYPKDHPHVTDTSHGALGVCGIFLGCHATSPLVKVWTPSTGEIAYHKEVEIFDDKMPFVDPSCMPDRRGFSDKDIEAMRKPNNHQASRTSPRTTAESALPASVHAANDAAQAPVPDMQASAAGDGDADLIQEASDKALATFSSKRKLLLDLGKDAFYEHAWKVQCVDTILHDGRVYVTLETLAGETPALTTQRAR